MTALQGFSQTHSNNDSSKLICLPRYKVEKALREHDSLQIAKAIISASDGSIDTLLTGLKQRDNIIAKQGLRIQTDSLLTINYAQTASIHEQQYNLSQIYISQLNQDLKRQKARTIEVGGIGIAVAGFLTYLLIK